MKTIAIDIECTKIPRHFPWIQGSFPVAIGVCDENGLAKTWVLNHNDETTINQKEILEEIQAEIDNAERIVGHNLKFDLVWLKHLGIDTSGVKVFCTMVAEYLLSGQLKQPYSLDETCDRRGIGRKKDKVKMYWDSGYETDEIPLPILLSYLEHDCRLAMSLYLQQSEELISMYLGPLTYIQMECMRVLSEIESNGMVFDREKAEGYVEEFVDRLKGIDETLHDLLGFNCNLNSGDELSAALYGGTIKRDGEEWVIRELKYESKYYPRKCKVEKKIEGLGFQPLDGTELKKEGFYSTDKNTLQQLKTRNKKQKEVIELILERSVLKKTLETFKGADDLKGLVNKIMEDGCVHPSYNQTVTRTGRLSSSDPNGQNLPRKGTSPIKKCIVPRYDKIGNADLSQLEWRTCAFLCQDPVMIDEIKHKIDYHLDNAEKYFGSADYRTDAKIFGFRMIYGGSAYGYFMDQKMPDFPLDKWKEIVSNFYTKYAQLGQWHSTNVGKVQSVGKLINPTGRWFQFLEEHIGEGGKGYSPRKIKNYPVQSLATADITPMCMVVIFKEMRRRGYRSLMIAQVHDSIVFDMVEDEIPGIAEICLTVFRHIPQYMKKYFGIEWNVPMDGEFEIGDNYGELEEYDG